MTLSSPLMLRPALKFGFFYGVILVTANISDFYFGSKGVLFAALISGIADADAIAIFVARHSYLDMRVGILAIVLGATVNTIMKCVIARVFGSKEFGTMIIKALIPAIIAGLFLVILL